MEICMVKGVAVQIEAFSPMRKPRRIQINIEAPKEVACQQ
jgi:hypothetical protein